MGYLGVDCGSGDLALRELEHPNTIPILVLENRGDLGALDGVRAFFDKELDLRGIKAVAIMNKFDMMIMHASSELGTATKWNQWADAWERSETKYHAWFNVGVPPGNASQDLEARLRESHSNEEQLIQTWKKRCGSLASWPEDIRFGLASFEEYVHSEQWHKLSSFVEAVKPKLPALVDDEQSLFLPRLQDHLLQDLTQLVSDGQKIWNGHLESGLYSTLVKKTLRQELDWLKEQKLDHRVRAMMRMFETGDRRQGVKRNVDCEAPAASDDRKPNGLQHWLVDAVCYAETCVLGLNATTRFSSCVERFAFACLWLNTTFHYTPEFFRNAMADQQKQSPNTAIMEYKRSMCSRVFRPLVEMMAVLLEDQFMRSMDAPFESEMVDQSGWFVSLIQAEVSVEDIRKAHREQALSLAQRSLMQYSRQFQCGKKRNLFMRQCSESPVIQVKTLAQASGREFRSLMDKDVQTLEAQLVHSFSDDESAEVFRLNQTLSVPKEEQKGGQRQYSAEALGRRQVLLKSWSSVSCFVIP